MGGKGAEENCGSCGMCFAYDRKHNKHIQTKSNIDEFSTICYFGTTSNAHYVYILQ